MRASSLSRIRLFRFRGPLLDSKWAIALLATILLALSCFLTEIDARGGRRGGKGKGKSNLQFAQVAEFSLIHRELADNRSAHIVTGSHFSQIFRLGFKLIIICRAKGDPRPMIKWFKEGAEMQPKTNVHYYQKPISTDEIWSKLEIDPATMGDQGVYACVANNQHGVMAKNFKAEYTY
ncbi:immunoglobulin i-set domain-containing protein [Ditylenchus destructor]|uniref:Immunoglobulin i-set domain-containing protein n=1 Tax=Ditylenchus destructor TaxID=166010 RepID=A0AAD4NB76_9BILA|nr:immunoglobulin i-set domain-containing protein [Ditylenchus destructor]